MESEYATLLANHADHGDDSSSHLFPPAPDLQYYYGGADNLQRQPQSAHWGPYLPPQIAAPLPGGTDPSSYPQLQDHTVTSPAGLPVQAEQLLPYAIPLQHTTAFSVSAPPLVGNGGGGGTISDHPSYAIPTGPTWPLSPAASASHHSPQPLPYATGPYPASHHLGLFAPSPPEFAPNPYISQPPDGQHTSSAVPCAAASSYRGNEMGGLPSQESIGSIGTGWAQQGRTNEYDPMGNNNAVVCQGGAGAGSRAGGDLGGLVVASASEPVGHRADATSASRMPPSPVVFTGPTGPPADYQVVNASPLIFSPANSNGHLYSESDPVIKFDPSSASYQHVSGERQDPYQQIMDVDDDEDDDDDDDEDKGDEEEGDEDEDEDEEDDEEEDDDDDDDDDDDEEDQSEEEPEAERYTTHLNLSTATTMPPPRLAARSSARTAAQVAACSVFPSPEQASPKIPAALGQRERNRIAANRCRRRTKDTISHLERQGKYEAELRGQLTAQAAQLRSEVQDLNNMLLHHSDCDCILIQQYLRNTAITGAGQADRPGGTAVRPLEASEEAYVR